MTGVSYAALFSYKYHLNAHEGTTRIKLGFQEHENMVLKIRMAVGPLTLEAGKSFVT